jgi:hypothetical protein
VKKPKATGSVSTSFFFVPKQNRGVMHLAAAAQKTDSNSRWAASGLRRFQDLYGRASLSGISAPQSTFGLLHKPMIFFIVLQWLDFATTIFGFSLGASELSPVVRTISLLTGPSLAVFVAKILTVLAMWRMSKRSVIVHAGNVWYSGIILWNLVIISKLIGHLHQAGSTL